MLATSRIYSESRPKIAGTVQFSLKAASGVYFITEVGRWDYGFLLVPSLLKLVAGTTAAFW